MEKPEIIWDGRYQAKKIENWITETAFCYRFPIYTVTKQKIKYCELIKAIYNYMKKRFRGNYGKYYVRELTIAFHYTEAPYRLTAAFMHDEKIIWSTDPAEQEETKRHLDWQAVEQFYNNFREGCFYVIRTKAEAKKTIENVGKITIKQPNIHLIQYKNSVKIKENYLCSNKKTFDRDTYITKDHDKNNYWSMFSELYEKMGGVTITRPKKRFAVANDYDCSGYFDDDAIFLNDWYAEDDDCQQEDYEQYIKNELDLTVDYLNYPHRMILHHFWDHERDIIFWSQDETEQDTVKKDFSCWKTIETFYNAYFERRNLYIEKNTVLVADFFATEERKEKTREQRKNNDPTNPEARKRRARRHLQRLEYDLRVSRQRYSKEKYQVIKLDGGKVVMGTNSLDDIERFYIEADYEKMTSTWEYYPAALYNKEPQLEKREAAATKVLKEMGYKLIRTKYYDGIYNRANYHIMRKKEKIWIDREDEFTLAEVEQFILSNS